VEDGPSPSREAHLEIYNSLTLPSNLRLSQFKLEQDIVG
jgi:hypothetical protein